MTTKLPEEARALIDDKNFATIATVEPDGRPQLSVVWVKTDRDDVLVSTVKGRRKADNIERVPMVTVLVSPADNPYTYVEVRGTATLEDKGAPALIQELSQKYTNGPYTNDGPDDERVIVRIRPDKVIVAG